MTPGELLAWVTAGSSLLINFWTLLGKSKDTTYTRIEAERNRLDTKVQGLEQRVEKVESELDALRADHRTLLDFLRDVASGQYDITWIQQRARELLARMGSRGGTP
ncbi:hypothetical protein [Deinococcus soli (ex Cha et al. 2016)]|uniref:hypothetical protein n=1 Tax=Deinococcus soli (ex Cha et al. 2016) TaxID=1309411 RepID=UPI0016665B35|nr:hypothetical protein [Deinococcus soli (ex Cha et al. 2016)]GGB85199.1 hypothetical protein GCM10008019_46410 [Deinococcus soli (ex Cha et al. 2016)]